MTASSTSYSVMTDDVTLDATHAFLVEFEVTPFEFATESDWCTEWDGIDLSPSSHYRNLALQKNHKVLQSGSWPIKNSVDRHRILSNEQDAINDALNTLDSYELSSTSRVRQPGERRQRAAVIPYAAKRPSQHLRKRQELLRLRAEVQGLEERLVILNVAKQQKQREPDMTKMNEQQIQLWKAVAERQREYRNKVELENKRLKDLVDAQTRLVESLKAAIEIREDSDVSTEG